MYGNFNNNVPVAELATNVRSHEESVRLANERRRNRLVYVRSFYRDGKRYEDIQYSLNGDVYYVSFKSTGQERIKVADGYSRKEFHAFREDVELHEDDILGYLKKNKDNIKNCCLDL